MSANIDCPGGPGWPSARPMAESEPDMGPHIIAVSTTLTVVAFVFLALRMGSKWYRSVYIWWDDTVLILAWFTLLANAIVISIACRLGFGRHLATIDSSKYPTLLVMEAVITSLSSLSAVWSKTSFAMTMTRCTAGRWRQLVLFIIVSINLSMTVAAVLPWIVCHPLHKLWQPCAEGYCLSIVPYLMFSGVYSGITDLVLAFLPWQIVWGLDLTFKKRIGVLVAMSLGAFAGGSAFVRSSHIPQRDQSDFTFDVAQLTWWSVAEPATTIMAASIPVLRMLFKQQPTTTTQPKSQTFRGDSSRAIRGEEESYSMSRTSRGRMTSRTTTKTDSVISLVPVVSDSKSDMDQEAAPGSHAQYRDGDLIEASHVEEADHADFDFIFDAENGEPRDNTTGMAGSASAHKLSHSQDRQTSTVSPGERP